MNKKIRYIFFFIGLSIFLLMLGLLLSNNVSNFDNTIYNMVSSFKCEPVTLVAKLLSFLSSTSFLIIFIIVIMIISKDKKKAFLLCLNIGLCCLLNQVLKFIIQRDRPVDINIVVEKGYSFPSGHSMVSFAFYGFFIYLINKKNKKKKKKIKNKLLYSILLCILILFIGISRIYLGVHFASDVLAGFSLSLAYLMLYIELYEKIITVWK